MSVVTEQYRSLVLDSRVLSHPFHRLVLTESKEAKEALHFWARQDYWVSRAFPSLLGLLIYTAPDPGVRHLLVTNLWAECGNGVFDCSHFRSYERLLDSIGLLPERHPCDPVTSFLKLQQALSVLDPLAAVTVFCYVNEYLSLFEFTSIKQGLGRLHPGADLGYFREIDSVDEGHTEELEVTISEYATPDSFDATAQAILAALEARAQLYDLAMESQ